MTQLNEHDTATDDAIFRRYIVDGDREALGELVRRYAGLVYSAARRQVGNPDLAADVMQNVFVTFAKRAREIRSAAALGTWLLQTTRFTSANAMRTESNRRFHERQASLRRPETVVTEEEQWDAVQPLLDEALSRLAAANQNAVVLRFLRGLSLRDVGYAIGTTEEGARKRVSRAIERLRKHLTAMGVEPATGEAEGLMAILTAHAVEPAPAAAVSHAASAAANVASGLILPGAIAMAATTKIAIGAGVAILVAVSGVGLVRLSGVSLFPQPNMPVLTSITQPAVPAATHPAPPSIGNWQTRFNAAYALASAQMAKLVAPPFISERGRWYRENTIPEQVTAIASPNKMVFTQNPDGTLTRKHMFGKDDIRTISQMVTELRAWQIGGDRALLDREIRGDWIYRATATPDEVLAGVASILSGRIGHEVHFIHSRPERDVITVSGQLTPQTVPVKVRMEWTAQQIAEHFNNGLGNHDRLAGNGIEFLLDNVSQATDTPFINENPPNSVFFEFGATETKDRQANAHGLAPDENLLNSLREQTGLQFMRERRVVDIWTLTSRF
jgi:RNA polymerase sigma factor (sigma-70 family)